VPTHGNLSMPPNSRVPLTLLSHRSFNPQYTPHRFIVRLVAFLGDDFADAVEDFLAANAARVTVVEGEEHSLESYAIFTAYLKLVEGKLEVGRETGSRAPPCLFLPPWQQ